MNATDIDAAVLFSRACIKEANRAAARGEHRKVTRHSRVHLLRAVAIQRAMVNRNANVAEDDRIVFRIGINVGDIIFDGEDIFGDGVNIAARLETLCEPGGICISRAANEQIRGKLSLAFADLGEQTVKNITHSIGVFGLTARDIEVLPEPDQPRTMPEVAKPQPAQRYEQEIQFCMTSDGVQLAYARTGSGPPLVKTGNWMTHLEFDFESPIWRRLYRELSRDHTLIRYDARGNGLSDRDIEEVSQEMFVSDLEVVVDAAGLERFALLGISQGCAVSIAYAVRHPERVTHLVLFGGYPVGWAKRARSAAEKEQGQAMLTLVRLGWGQEPSVSAAFYVSIHPRGHQGAGRLVHRVATHIGFAGRRRAQFDRQWRYRCQRAVGPSVRADARDARTRRCSRAVRSGQASRRGHPRRPVRVAGEPQPFNPRRRTGLSTLRGGNQVVSCGVGIDAPKKERRDGVLCRDEALAIAGA